MITKIFLSWAIAFFIIMACGFYEIEHFNPKIRYHLIAVWLLSGIGIGLYYVWFIMNI